MADLLIRNLGQDVAERLKLLARQKGVSMSEEARRILDEGTRLTRKQIAAEAAAMRARQKPGRLKAVDLIREGRERGW